MLAAIGLSIIVAGPFAVEGHGQVVPVSRTSGIERTGLFLMAGDYRRALEACEQAIQERPSAEAYLQLTYVYQAIDAYLEQLYLNLAYRHTEDLVDPPGGLARMAKEMIQTSVRQQSDVSAARAVRLNKATADRFWQEQAQWRYTHPTEWWRAFPDSWVR